MQDSDFLKFQFVLWSIIQLENAINIVIAMYTNLDLFLRILFQYFDVAFCISL
jgi:hypothetical protein